MAFRSGLFGSQSIQQCLDEQLIHSLSLMNPTFFGQAVSIQDKMLMRIYLFCCSGLQMDHTSLLKQFEHLDPHNQNTFEAKDLELLISTVRQED